MTALQWPHSNGRLKNARANVCPGARAQCLPRGNDDATNLGSGGALAGAVPRGGRARLRHQCSDHRHCPQSTCRPRVAPCVVREVGGVRWSGAGAKRGSTFCQVRRCLVAHACVMYRLAGMEATKRKLSTRDADEAAGAIDVCFSFMGCNDFYYYLFFEEIIICLAG